MIETVGCRFLWKSGSVRSVLVGFGARCRPVRWPGRVVCSSAGR